MSNLKKMKWQKDLDTYFPLYNTFILEGFIDDDVPFEDADGNVTFCKVYDYFDKLYSHNQDDSLRKRVIIYDPTESVEKRFTICDDGPSETCTGQCDSCPVNCSLREESAEARVQTKYTSELSQRFWNIAHNDDISKLLIGHSSSGVSLDVAKIHYAVTEDDEFKRITDSDKRRFESAFSALLNLFDEATRSPEEPTGYVFIIKMTSRLLSRSGDSNGLSNEELMLFRQFMNIATSLDRRSDEGMALQHKLVILANQAKDLPSWFTDEFTNPTVKKINVERPSEENKLEFFRDMLDDGSVFGEEFMSKYNEIAGPDPTVKNSVQKKFLAYTNDFSMKMLRRFREYLSRQQLADPSKLGFAISSFLAGDLTNPWDDEDIQKQILEIGEKVGQRIIGQEHALAAAQEILTRSTIGLNRAENPNAPRAILFLAGPTGTGKTELCKQIAECVFGSEDRIVRFDMSEYGQEEADQKLFGAPPGYIGYEEGGKLTNAVKKEPFSLILFDEIEKAHNSILDKFLQILGDGRLTDGKGETVRFTDCIIVITSNAGVASFDGKSQAEIDSLMNGDVRPEVSMDMERVKEYEEMGKTPDEIYALVREYLRYNVKAYFYCGLGRPELYGRIEDSLVYYNYIGKAAVGNIVASKIKSASKAAIAAMGVESVECGDDVRSAINDYCQSCNVRALGARGILKSTDKLFTGSLSNFLSDYIRGADGKSRQDLVGRTIACTCQGSINSANDITWSVR